MHWSRHCDEGVLPELRGQTLRNSALERGIAIAMKKVHFASSTCNIYTSRLSRIPTYLSQRSGCITVVRSKTDAGAQGAVVAITPAAMGALSAIRPAGAGAEARVFELSESQIARRVKAIAKAVGLADWEFFSGHSGRVGMARRMAQNALPPTRSNAKAAGNRAGGMVGSCTRV